MGNCGVRLTKVSGKGTGKRTPGIENHRLASTPPPSSPPLTLREQQSSDLFRAIFPDIPTRYPNSASPGDAPEREGQ